VANEEQEDVAPDETFGEAVLGKAFFQDRNIKKLLAYPMSWRIVAAVVTFAFVLFVPYLGAVGLWDPWETHYSEVARMMIVRNDYVHPYWESAWFFSKPAFTMWMQAFAMQLAGTMRTEGALATYTEWAIRLTFVSFIITGVALLSLAVARVVSRRAGLATAFVLCTMPMFFLITRQAVTDTPMLAATMCAIACAMIGQLDENTKHRAGWWYGFYIFCAIGTLAKESLGVLPGVVLLIYAALSEFRWEEMSLEDHLKWLADGAFRAQVRDGKRPMPPVWAQLFRMKFGTGILVFLAVAMPWYAVMFAFDGVDDEGKLFWYRVIVHDNLNRLVAGVHTTTPGGSFTYFIEQGGFAIFPWVAAVPGAVSVVARLKFRSLAKSDQLGVMAAIWLIFSFFLMGISATKFHHYAFPMLPPLAILIALFIDKLWAEGVGKHGMVLLFGLPFFILVGKDLSGNPKNFTDLFVYNYDRPYPFDLVQKPIAMWTTRALWMGDLVALALVGLGAYLLYDAFAGKDRSPFYKAVALLLALVGGTVLMVMLSRATVSPTLFVGLSVVLTALYLAYEATRPQSNSKWGLTVAAAVLGAAGLPLVVRGARLAVAEDLLVPLLVDPVNIKEAMGFAFAVAGAVITVAALMRSRVALFGAFWAFTFAFALWFNWSHWVDLSHQWTQRDLFWRYYAQKRPGEPITAFLMNWRGETFYSKNTVKQIKDNGVLNQYAHQPGRQWALVEQARLGILKSAVGTDKTVTLIDRDLNNKFVLVTIE
jgi:4-amino-4-deoxy-L-arabinose transferase-like glycosyltransferase